MIGYLSGILVFVLYAYWIIQTYYVQYRHGETASGLAWYFAAVGAMWAAYKAWTAFGMRRAKDGTVGVPRWTFPAALFLLVFLGCHLFFSLSGSAGAGGSVLAAKILGWSLLPGSLALVLYGVGKRLLAWALPQRPGEHWQAWSLLAIASGWAAFLTVWALAGVLGGLNAWVFCLTFVAAAAYGWRQSLEALAWWGGEWRQEPGSVRAVTSEWFFVVLAFTFASNLVNIVRPMPIGWDDLGVYMNLPKLMAQAGAVFQGSGLVAWQSYTAIGFAFGSPTQAFFLSCLGGVLGTWALWLAVSHALRARKTLVDVPLLAVTALYVMPMVVFQQAKDMKVDMGLLAITVGAVYPLAVLLVSEVRSGRWARVPGLSGHAGDVSVPASGWGWRPYALVGLALGAAFAIKATTLMTFLGAFALLAASAAGWPAFLGWCLSVSGVFTLVGAWKLLNVPVPAGIDVLPYGLALLALGVVGIGWSLVRRSSSWFRGAAAAAAALAAAAAVSLSPWISKNLYETVSAGQPLSVGTILSGYGSDRVRPALGAVYAPQELERKAQEEKDALAAKSGQTANEDLGRYIGYELGLNNYAKLPWNMTMQVNQAGEFTDITYLYLLLLPGSFLFLAYRRSWYVVFPIAAAAAAYTLFVWQPAYFVPAQSYDLIRANARLFVQDPPSQSPEPWRHPVEEDPEAPFAQRLGDSFRDLARPLVSALTPAAWKTSMYDLPWTGSGAETLSRFMADADAYGRTGVLPATPAGWSDRDAAAYANLLTKAVSVSFGRNVSSASIASDPDLSSADRAALLDLKVRHRSLSQAATDVLSGMALPFGYVWLVLAALVLLGFLWFATSDEPDHAEMRAHATFAAPYVLLYAVAAFAIPWYGIMMYASFLILAAYGLSAMVRDDALATPTERTYRAVGAAVLALSVSVYFLNSAIPHAANNLASASWNGYKVGASTVEEEILSPTVRPGYLEILAGLNLKDSVRPLAASVPKWAASPRADERYLAKVAAANGVADAGPVRAYRFLQSIRDQLRANPQYAPYATVAADALRSVGRQVLYPSPSDRNEGKIFRLGTFMTYHVSQNVSRFWDDSLLTWFDRYVADADPEVAAARMKKLGFSYLLADLNAATIDRDPRHDLTRRYEGLLWSFYAPSLELIHTDNLCIKAARATPGMSKAQFVSVAGTNYESFAADGTAVSRDQKRRNCADFIAGKILDGTASAVPELQDMAVAFTGTTDPAQLAGKILPYVSGATWMAVFKVK